jgi:phosphatidylinositol-3-phosphatase
MKQRAISIAAAVTSLAAVGCTPCGVCNAGFSCDSSSNLCKTPDGVPQLTHVWIVLMGNTSYADITSTSAPYLTGVLYPQGVQLTNYFSVASPSLPNDIALVGGDTFGISADGPANQATFQVPVVNPDIASQLEASGLTWHAYAESQLAPCQLIDTGSDDQGGSFVSHHSPMSHFDVTQQSAGCAASDTSYELEGEMPGISGDMDAGNFYGYTLITPNLCDDGDDSCDPQDAPITQEDDWLRANVPAILSSAAYQDDGVLMITWAQGNNASSSGITQVAAVILSPMLAIQGSSDGTLYSHYSTLATIETGFGLPSLPLANGHGDALIADIWQGSTPNPTSGGPTTGTSGSANTSGGTVTSGTTAGATTGEAVTTSGGSTTSGGGTSGSSGSSTTGGTSCGQTDVDSCSSNDTCCSKNCDQDECACNCGGGTLPCVTDADCCTDMSSGDCDSGSYSTGCMDGLCQ